MNFQLKRKDHYFLNLHQFCIENVAYILFFLTPLVTVAQNTTTVYIDKETTIYGINHIHCKKIIEKQIHLEPIYITEENLFYADSSLVALISFVEKNEKHLKKSVFKTISTKKSTASKAIVQQESLFKYKKNTIPFEAKHLFKNGSVVVVSASNIAKDLKAKNNVLAVEKRINRIYLTLSVEVKKTIYTTLFLNRKTLKQGITNFNRPPPFLFV